jgi:hypothetical protein
VETRKNEPKSATPPAQKQPERKRRFQVVKLEERIAPAAGLPTINGAHLCTSR